MKTVSEESAPAAELEQHLDTPNSIDEAMETGFLPDDEHYRLTGEFKKEKDPTEADTETASKKDQSGKADASAASSEADTAAASAAAQSQSTEEKRPTGKTAAASESRWAKLSRENRELKEKLAQKEAARTQEPARETQQPPQPATEAKAAPKPKIDDVDEKTGKPKYKSYAEYEDAKDQWLRQDTLREFNESQAKTQQVTAQQQAEREIGQTLSKKFEPLRAKYPDFDKVALNDIDPATGKPKFPDSPVLFIPAKSVTDDFIVRSPHGGEVLYYLGQHPEITQGFYGRNQAGVPINLIHPLDQTRKLMEIEAQFSGAAASDKSGDTSDRNSSSSSSSARPVTQASRPPHQVSGTGTVAKDAVEQAVEDGDTETYMRAQNAKELARLKKK